MDTFAVNATAIATNMWNPQILGLDQTLFFAVVVVIVIMVVVLVLVMFARRKK